MKNKTELYRTDWNGILLEIIYEPLWMPAHVTGEDLAHIEVHSLYPTHSRCRSQRPAFTQTPCRHPPSPQAATSPTST